MVFSCVCSRDSRSGGGGSRWCPVEQGDWVQASGGAPSRQGPGARVAGWTRNPEEAQPWRDPRSQTSVQSPAHSISFDTPWPGSPAKSFLPAQGHGLLTLLFWLPPPAHPPLCEGGLFSLQEVGTRPKHMAAMVPASPSKPLSLTLTSPHRAVVGCSRLTPAQESGF